MKKVFAVISAILICACTTKATINGFVASVDGGAYDVPSTNILALEAVSFAPNTPSNYLYISISGAPVFFRNATNGLYTLPKALLIPGGDYVTAGNGSYPVTLMGALIDSSDAPLFVGVGSSLTNLVVTGNTVTGVLQLSRTAVGSKVLFQSSANLVDWSFDSSVIVLRGSDDTKRQFRIPVASNQRFYRALVRRQCSEYGG